MKRVWGIKLPWYSLWIVAGVPFPKKIWREIRIWNIIKMFVMHMLLLSTFWLYHHISGLTFRLHNWTMLMKRDQTSPASYSKSGHDKLPYNIVLEISMHWLKKKRYYCPSADKNVLVRTLLDIGDVYLWSSRHETYSSTVGGTGKKSWEGFKI